jgi:predicted nucleotidyltransferase
MSANIENGKLSGTLFGKTRRAVLSLLYGHPDESFYLRQLARLAGVGMGSIQRELRQLAEAGIIRRFHIGRQVFFQSNPDCPVYSELKSLVVKTIGAGDVIRGALLPLAGKIRLAFIFGSMARGRGRRDSDIDVMIVGQVDFAQVVEALSPAQDTLAREINPTVYPQAEFIAKAKKGNHFLMSVLDSEKFFLIGDSNELTKLVE